MSNYLPDSAEDLTPATKLVFLVLRQADEPLNTATLRERTLLSDSTIRDATSRLEERGYVWTETSLTDARETLYDTP